jgi:hypothetical protein
MFEPIHYESLDFRTRCQIRRMESLTGAPRDEIIRNAIYQYFQYVMATVSDEQLEAERKRVYNDSSQDSERRASWIEAGRDARR